MIKHVTECGTFRERTAVEEWHQRTLRGPGRRTRSARRRSGAVNIFSHWAILDASWKGLCVLMGINPSMLCCDRLIDVGLCGWMFLETRQIADRYDGLLPAPKATLCDNVNADVAVLT